LVYVSNISDVMSVWGSKNKPFHLNSTEKAVFLNNQTQEGSFFLIRWRTTRWLEFRGCYVNEGAWSWEM